MHTLAIQLSLIHNLAAGYSDVVITDAMRYELELGAGTDGKADVAIRLATTLSASATVDVDLRALTGPAGESIALAEVHAIVGKIATPSGTGTVTPHATNGWTGLGSAYSIPVSANGAFAIASGPGIAVTTTNKVFTYTNTSGVSTAIVLYILGRKA